MKNSFRILMIAIFALGVLAPLTCLYADGTDFMEPPGAPDSEESKQWMLNQREPRKAIPELPFTINEPGSWFLSGHLMGTNGQPGITIDSDDVKLDLCGFALNGVPGSAHGITVIGSERHNIVIRNGLIRGWEGMGIQADVNNPRERRGRHQERIFIRTGQA